MLSYNKNDHTKGFDTNILNNNDNEFEKLLTELKFKYYQNHGFHKTKQDFTKSNTLSIFHTNISYININDENPETLSIIYLDHKFDVIALSETRTPKN